MTSVLKVPFNKWSKCLPLLIFCAGVFLRGLYLIKVIPFLHYDEAPQAFLAQQITIGNFFPIVHLQLPYVGAVEQYPLALLMLALGDMVFTVKLFYFLLSVFSLGLAYWLYRIILTEKWSYLAFSFFAICPPSFVLQTSLLGYSFGSLIVFELLILLLVLSYSAKKKIFFVCLGLCSGLALYNNILIIGVLGFALLVAITSFSRVEQILLSLGFFIGYFPMIYFNWNHGFISYQILVAKFLNISRSMVEEQGIIGAIGSGIVNKLSGNNPADYQLHLFPDYLTVSTWDYYFHFITSSIFISVLCLAVVALLPKWQGGATITVGFSTYQKRIFYLCALGTMILSMSAARYLTAVVPFIPILMCDGLAICHKLNRGLAIACIVCCISYLVILHIQEIFKGHPDQNHSIYAFLEKNQLTHGYGSYALQSYAAFLSRGKIKISPQIGPDFTDKIPWYSQIVDQAKEVFYILPASFSLDYFQKNGVKYDVQKIEESIIIWNLSKRVFPKDILPPGQLTQAQGYNRWSYRENPAVLKVFTGGH